MLSTPFAAHDMHAAPASTPNDGLFHILAVPGRCSRTQVLNMFTRLEQGEHLDSPACVYVTARAYRVEPDAGSGGYVTMDGERVPLGPFQAEVHRGIARVMAARGAVL